jgi:hypothetical protein
MALWATPAGSGAAQPEQAPFTAGF